MPTLQIGRKEITYELFRSAAASERRITVTPERVEVLALTTDDDVAVAAFLQRKRQWVFDTVREMEAITAGRHSVPKFMTGSKIPYRGRLMPLTVRRTDSETMAINYRGGFVVDLPVWVGSDPSELVASELKHWLRRRAREDVMSTAERFGRRYGMRPQSIRLADFSSGWGSCGPKGNILINWHLIFAPKKVLEYVVVHELAHLSVRSHGDAFWRQLEVLLPSYQKPKAWLELHQAMLSSEFLA